MKRHSAYTPVPETILDRVVAGVVSAILMAILAIAGPFLTDIDMFAEGVGIEVYGKGFIAWALALVVSTLVTGFLAGPRKMARFWGYLFATEEPERPGVTAAIWIGIVAILLISTFVA